MARTFEYVLLTFMAFGLVLLFVKPLVDRTADSLTVSAECISNPETCRRD